MRVLCEYCRSPERLAGHTFEVEHIVPTARGGEDTFSNLALACSHCNKAKGVRQGARDPYTGHLGPFFNPRTSRWGDHFAWQDDFITVVGLTSEGRATAEALRFNSVRRRDARILWRALASLGLGDPPFTWP